VGEVHPTVRQDGSGDVSTTFRRLFTCCGWNPQPEAIEHEPVQRNGTSWISGWEKRQETGLGFRLAGDSAQRRTKRSRGTPSFAQLHPSPRAHQLA
jgi:hypothetical protein